MQIEFFKLKRYVITTMIVENSFFPKTKLRVFLINSGSIDSNETQRGNNRACPLTKRMSNTNKTMECAREARTLLLSYSFWRERDKAAFSAQYVWSKYREKINI